MFDIRKIQEKVIFDAVKNESDEQTAQSVVEGNQEDDPTWVKNTMSRLEKRFDAQTVKKIRMHCQCGYGMEERLEFIKSLIYRSSSMEEFASHEEARAAGLSFSDGTLYLQFPFCPCPMLANVDRLKTNTWCQCTTGYSKVLFEKAMGCNVEVELLKSIKMGDEICLMKIVPDDFTFGSI